MCGGAIIFDYIPARRRVSAADFWPDSEADAEYSHASHTPAPEGGKQLCFRSVLLCFFLHPSSELQTVNGVCE